jgi:hypothetical protein
VTTCPLCGQRKGKRNCPALSAAICSRCCGSKRRVEVACPEDCAYLTGDHAGAWDGRENEQRRDLLRIAPFIQSLTEAQSRLVFLAVAGIAGLRAGRRDLDDRILAAAVGALRRTLETRARGLIYDHVPDDPRAQRLLAELVGLFEAKDREGRPSAPAEPDLLAALVALEAAVAHSLQQGKGATAFLDATARLAARMGAPTRVARPLIVAP